MIVVRAQRRMHLLGKTCNKRPEIDAFTAPNTRWRVACDRSGMNLVNRSCLMIAACFGLVVASAQETPTKTQPVPQHTDPPPANRDQRAGRSLETSAGNPEGVYHPGSVGFADAGLSALVLDPGQAERIRRMNERYAEEFTVLGPASRTDPAYLTLWQDREKEIASILTPLQFSRWQELNNTDVQPTPAPMPNANLDDNSMTPLPSSQVDSTRDRMPTVDTLRIPQLEPLPQENK